MWALDTDYRDFVPEDRSLRSRLGKQLNWTVAITGRDRRERSSAFLSPTLFVAQGDGRVDG